MASETRPLLRLLLGNLHQAHALGMIECDQADLDVEAERIMAGWAQDAGLAAQRERFKQAHGALRLRFDSRFRPIQAFRGRRLPFCNVMGLGSLNSYWLGKLPVQGSGHIEAMQAVQTIAVHASSAVAATGEDIDDLRLAFAHLNHWLARAGRSRHQPGIRLGIGELLDPATRPFWVGGRVNKPQMSAQYWRDRLGMVHLGCERRSAAELLVRLRFVADFADQELPRSDPIRHSRTHENLLWLFRPCMLHTNNRRFLQRVESDRPARPARRGSTRDLAHADYAAGEREMLLLTGGLASARLVGIDLFEGHAEKREDRDENDADFVARLLHLL